MMWRRRTRAFFMLPLLLFGALFVGFFLFKLAIGILAIGVLVIAALMLAGIFRRL